MLTSELDLLESSPLPSALVSSTMFMILSKVSPAQSGQMIPQIRAIILKTPGDEAKSAPIKLTRTKREMADPARWMTTRVLISFDSCTLMPATNSFSSPWRSTATIFQPAIRTRRIHAKKFCMYLTTAFFDILSFLSLNCRW